MNAIGGWWRRLDTGATGIEHGPRDGYIHDASIVGLDRYAAYRRVSGGARARCAFPLRTDIDGDAAQVFPLKARLGPLLMRDEANRDRNAAASCWDLNQWRAVLWTFTKVEGMEPTNNVSERALWPAVLWRKGSFGIDADAGSR